MKYPIIVLLFLVGTAASAGSKFDDGVRYKQQQKLPEAISAFREVLTDEPQNSQAWEQLAIVESWLNHFDESITAWRKLLQITPHQASAHAGLARVLYWKGEHAEALREVDIALGLEPNNADVLVLKGDVLLADDKREQAHDVYFQAQALAKNDVEIEKKIVRTEAPKNWRIDLGHGADQFSAMRGAENSSYMQIGYRASADTSLYVRTERYDNFHKVNIGVTPGGFFRLAPWYLLNAEAYFNVDEPDFRPKRIILLNSELLIDGPLQPLLGLRFMHYKDNVLSASPGGGVTTITPGVRVLMAPASLELRYGFSNNTDDSDTGIYQAKLQMELENYTPYLLYASGREALPPLKTAQIRILGVGCVFSLNNTWGARIDLTHEDRKAFYRHNTLAAGITWHF
ncbi:MAG: YaiO family outer membrane beta-barrel protein [Methylobacter sp.]